MPVGITIIKTGYYEYINAFILFCHQNILISRLEHVIFWTPFDLHGLILTPAWISIYIPVKCGMKLLIYSQTLTLH